MHLMLILGIVFAIGAVVFALQNNVAVVVSIALWQFEGSLALVLLVALGLGVLIAGLVSSPTVIRGQWVASRLRHQVAELEEKLRQQQLRNDDLAAELATFTPAIEGAEPVEEKPYVGFREMLAGDDDVRRSPN
jgi:lipopolysaccharide assembly protein A